ncbi:uncharacterized protein LOC131692457 [Topomyia yanbarensis]|uniref:uncharacterized protein LOC131683019 n=1 Tax=Topomyia yanbarensis TaxID=2498891 RepID=UPI00273BF0C8|nr:uncharacterized protein LOC131683019 [Topomyia yanbarensis]XP_058820833.1 uncharacterized protein LOC131683019 [Topomyia yanbarensis]XP_058835495.1 uncharacterized protein LOC131692457 [Topomyia yanbarensis]XP_058835496.1 uncharacterized protein LOC131692457 [Topomyia yanbarensis]
MAFEGKQFPLDPFNDAVDTQDLRREWEEWHRAFELTLELRNAEFQHEKLVLLLACGGRGLQRIFYNLRPSSDEFYPEPVKVPLMPIEIPEYDNAIKRLNKFFIGKRNERIELEVFRSMKQTADETFNQFLLRLRGQAARCDFFDREEKEIMQQVTMGARDERVRDKGLEDVMDLDELITYAINREILIKQKGKTRSFSDELSGTSVASVNQNWSKRPRYNDVNHGKYGSKMDIGNRRSAGERNQPECNRCGSFRHKADSQNCYARSARCNGCGILGHYARKCRNMSKVRGGDTRYKRNRPSGEMNAVRQDEEWKEEMSLQTDMEPNSKVACYK